MDFPIGTKVRSYQHPLGEKELIGRVIGHERVTQLDLDLNYLYLCNSKVGDLIIIIEENGTGCTFRYHPDGLKPIDTLA